MNAQGGVTIAGKKYQINLVAKDDAYDAAKTVANVQLVDQRLRKCSVCSTWSARRTTSPIRNTVNTDCVPNMLIASGAVQWGNPKFPWMIGSELVPYPLEVQTFVDYLKQKKPNATIAVLKANDDFGQSYDDTLKELVKGTHLKIVQTQGYDPEHLRRQGPGDEPGATQRRRVLDRRNPARVPERVERGGRRGLEADHVHVGDVRVEGAVRRSPARTPTTSRV